MSSNEIELGSEISKPTISIKLKPGGWYTLTENSPFILSSLSESLTYIENNYNQKLPDDPKIILSTAGSQVVASSVNVFLEFRILNMPDSVNRDVRVIVNDKSVAVKDSFIHELKVTKIYITSKKLF